MKQPEYKGAGWAIHAETDCVEGMWAMPENSVDCVITSVPFGDLFVYSDSERDLGNAGEGEAFAKQYRFFAEALTRILRPGRIACIHCTDLPMRKGKHGAIGLQDFSGDLVRAHTAAGLVYHGRATIWKNPVVEMQRTKAVGLLHKQIKKDSAMCRVGMPDYMLFFRKDAPNEKPIQHAYAGDGDPVAIVRAWMEELRGQGLLRSVPDDAAIAAFMAEAEFSIDEWQALASPVWMDIDQGEVLKNFRDARDDEDEKHVCPLQLGVIRKCLRLYSRPGDVVLDPFNGIGSTGYEAVKSHRRYLGFELKAKYAAMANRNLQEAELASQDIFSRFAEDAA
ncbi:DNA-methyltransferase [Sagittula sp. S175]|uniref:DNA-methyltransferase n=1 Tax=Sagittula sp. S175 TaxID=3415129 RepID=UPI003C7C479E